MFCKGLMFRPLLKERATTAFLLNIQLTQKHARWQILEK